jgi:uncharacterized DUF497 family protein
MAGTSAYRVETFLDAGRSFKPQSPTNAPAPAAKESSPYRAAHHPLPSVHFANPGNELLVDSGPDRLRWWGNVLFRQIQHLAYGVHHQTRLNTAQIHDDDARSVVGRFGFQLEPHPRIQYRDYFSAQVRDALDELRGLRHFSDHSVSPDEAEAAILDPHAMMLEIQTDEEERVKAVGATSAGRIVVVIFTWSGEAIRATTAYDASVGDQRLYFEGEHI